MNKDVDFGRHSLSTIILLMTGLTPYYSDSIPVTAEIV